MVKQEYEDVVKNEVQKAISADEEAIARLCGNYVDNIKAYTFHEKVRNKFTGQEDDPDERLMRSIEEKIDIPESRKDDFRREIMNYIAALALEGKQFDYKTNERLQKALELKLFEDQKDSIKLTSLVSSVVDKDTQEKIDIVKGRLIKNYGYCDVCATDVLNYVASIFARGDTQEALRSAAVTAMLRKIERDVKRFKQIVRGRHQEGLPQVPHAGRADRPPGQAHRLHPAPADRDPALPLRQQGGGRRRARARASAGDPLDGAARAREPGQHILEVEVGLDELAAILGEELELPAHPAARAPHGARGEGEVLEHPPGGAGEPAPLQAHLPRGAEAPDRHRASTTPRPRHRPHPRGPPLPLLARARGAGVATRSSSSAWT